MFQIPNKDSIKRMEDQLIEESSSESFKDFHNMIKNPFKDQLRILYQVSIQKEWKN